MTELNFEIKSRLPLFDNINRMLDNLSRDLARGKRAQSFIVDSQNEEMIELYSDSLGRSLHNIYCGMEKIMEDIAMEIDKVKPAGKSYHKQLLEQMSTEIKDRPAIIDMNNDIIDILGFRHVFRNLYGQPLRSNEMMEKLHIVEHGILPGFIGNLENLRISMESDIEDPFMKEKARINQLSDSQKPSEPGEF